MLESGTESALQFYINASQLYNLHVTSGFSGLFYILQSRLELNHIS